MPVVDQRIPIGIHCIADHDGGVSRADGNREDAQSQNDRATVCWFGGIAVAACAGARTENENEQERPPGIPPHLTKPRLEIDLGDAPLLVLAEGAQVKALAGIWAYCRVADHPVVAERAPACATRSLRTTYLDRPRPNDRVLSILDHSRPVDQGAEAKSQLLGAGQLLREERSSLSLGAFSWSQTGATSSGRAVPFPGPFPRRQAHSSRGPDRPESSRQELADLHVRSQSRPAWRTRGWRWGATAGIIPAVFRGRPGSAKVASSGHAWRGRTDGGTLPGHPCGHARAPATRTLAHRARKSPQSCRGAAPPPPCEVPAVIVRSAMRVRKCRAPMRARDGRILVLRHARATRDGTGAALDR